MTTNNKNKPATPAQLSALLADCTRKATLPTTPSAKAATFAAKIKNQLAAPTNQEHKQTATSPRRQASQTDLRLAAVLEINNYYKDSYTKSQASKMLAGIYCSISGLHLAKNTNFGGGLEYSYHFIFNHSEHDLIPYLVQANTRQDKTLGILAILKDLGLLVADRPVLVDSACINSYLRLVNFHYAITTIAKLAGIQSYLPRFTPPSTAYKLSDYVDNLITQYQKLLRTSYLDVYQNTQNSTLESAQFADGSVYPTKLDNLVGKYNKRFADSINRYSASKGRELLASLAANNEPVAQNLAALAQAFNANDCSLDFLTKAYSIILAATPDGKATAELQVLVKHHLSTKVTTLITLHNQLGTASSQEFNPSTGELTDLDPEYTLLSDADLSMLKTTSKFKLANAPTRKTLGSPATSTLLAKRSLNRITQFKKG